MTTTSMRAIGDWVDVVNPPRRLRGTVSLDDPNFMASPEKGLLASHRWRPTVGSAASSFRAVSNRYHEAHSATHRLLYYNTWLLNDPRDPNQRQARAAGIGRKLAADYDIAGLSEVYADAELQRVREQLTGLTYEYRTGTPSSFPQTSAGLVTLSFTREDRSRPIIHSERHEYDEDGSGLDVDRWARKGVLLSTIDVGSGLIDYYTTHLFSGAGLGEGWDYHELLNHPEVNEVRLAQVAELLQFVTDTRNPHHVAIIAGDFNISAGGPYYDRLQNMMDEAGFSDTWSDRGGAVGHTYLKAQENDIYDICLFSPDSGPDYYCNDYIPSPEGTDIHRIDYIFIERPTAEHGLNVDVARMRRRPFWRRTSSSPATFETEDGPEYLSDHLGLELTVRTSPIAED